MNPIETLGQILHDVFPKAKLDLDPPEQEKGSWFLDIGLDKYRIVVEWSVHRGFGVTAGRKGVYGEGPDELYPDLGTVMVRRVLWLMEHRTPTNPPLADQLRRIRVKRNLTQHDLADRLKVKQSSVSRLEGRGETASIRKLQELVAAMGGQLSLRISFADTDETEDLALGELRTGTSG
jgi:DNA-binding Xre family transcriptional regulator